MHCLWRRDVSHPSFPHKLLSFEPGGRAWTQGRYGGRESPCPSQPPLPCHHRAAPAAGTQLRVRAFLNEPKPPPAAFSTSHLSQLYSATLSPTFSAASPRLCLPERAPRAANRLSERSAAPSRHLPR